MRIKNLPRQITKFTGKKEEILELQKIYNVIRNDIQITNMLRKALI